MHQSFRLKLFSTRLEAPQGGRSDPIHLFLFEYLSSSLLLREHLPAYGECRGAQPWSIRVGRSEGRSGLIRANKPISPAGLASPDCTPGRGAVSGDELTARIPGGGQTISTWQDSRVGSTPVLTTPPPRRGGVRPITLGMLTYGSFTEALFNPRPLAPHPEPLVPNPSPLTRNP